jgi:hypothetical protein
MYILSSVVIVLAVGHKGNGLKPSRGWIFKGDKNPWHDFLWRGSKAISPMLLGISLSLATPSKPVRYEWPYQQLCCGIALDFIGAHKSPHPTKCFQQGGGTSKGDGYISTTQL